MNGDNSASNRPQTGSQILRQPALTPLGLEISLHTCPKSLVRELRHIFPGTELEGILALPTNQKAVLDLVNVGERVEDEKDRLLNTFVSFAAELCRRVRAAGHWADYIDPCSGLPMLTGGNKCYSEVEGMQMLLRYQVMNAATCKVLLHPSWGSAVYPASIFTTAPVDIITAFMDEELSAKQEGEVDSARQEPGKRGE